MIDKRHLQAGSGLLILIIISTLILAGVVGYAWRQNVDSDTSEKVKMTNYLEQKYGQEFVVDNPEYTDGGFGVDGIWRATAYPKSDKSLTFDLDANKSITAVYDQYVAALWSREQSNKIQTETETIYGSDAKTKVAVRITFSDDLVKEANLKSPTYEQAKREYADRGFYYKYLINTPAILDASAESGRVYGLIELARKDGVKEIGVSHIEEKSGSEWICNIGSSKIEIMRDATEIKNCLENKVKVTH